MAATWGLLGSGDWATGEVPESYRVAVLRFFPNGTVPLTALLSKTRSEPLDSTVHNWWEKGLPTMIGTVTGIYDDAHLSTAYVSGGVAGSILYFKMSLEHVSYFRRGQQVLCRDVDQPSVDVAGEVLSAVKNGANSYVSVELLEADDNGAGVTKDLSDCDRLKILGSINSEGAGIPPAVHYPPTLRTNYPQIWRTPLDITKTSMAIRMRTGDPRPMLRKEILELHSVGMESSLMWSTPYVGVGDNGKPKRTTAGMVYWIKTYNSANVADFRTDNDAVTWASGGEDWLDAKIGLTSVYGADRKLAYCGQGALEGIAKLAKLGGQINLTPIRRASYGIEVRTLIGVGVTVDLQTHPLLSIDPTTNNAMIIFEPQRLVWRPIRGRDTKLLKCSRESTTDEAGLDAIQEEYLTEGLLEIQHPETMGYFTGVGCDGPNA